MENTGFTIICNNCKQKDARIVKLERELFDTKVERDKLNNQLLNICKTFKVFCFYCDWEGTYGETEYKQAIREHTLHCPNHPYHKIQKILDNV